MILREQTTSPVIRRPWNANWRRLSAVALLFRLGGSSDTFSHVYRASLNAMRIYRPVTASVPVTLLKATGGFPAELRDTKSGEVKIPGAKSKNHRGPDVRYLCMPPPHVTDGNSCNCTICKSVTYLAITSICSLACDMKESRNCILPALPVAAPAGQADSIPE
jgi:hypothetical protein